MSFLKKIDRLNRLEFLLPETEQYNNAKINLALQTKEPANTKTNLLSTLIQDAGLSLHYSSLLLLCFTLGAIFSYLASLGLHWIVLPLFFSTGALCPLLALDCLANKRAGRFSADYPAVLLTTASSLKSGLSPQVALSRAAKLLPSASPVRLECEKLLDSLHCGLSQELAIANFGAGVRLPELRLFRSAFLLVLQDGGRFSNTLERLADLSRDREQLKSTAAVSTSTMKMTANILLVIAPLVVLTVSLHDKNYWPTMLENPNANLFGSLGLVMIIAGYLSLRFMSAFKP